MAEGRSIYHGKVKESKYRVQGFLTPFGMGAFERHRRALAKRVKKEASKVSDADVVEYLARGKVL